MSPIAIVPLREAMQAKVDSTNPSLPIVLIVDDEKIIADTLGAIFRTNGYTALTAYDARTALDLAEAAPPALMISDVMMPRMNGIELAITMRELFPACKILLFSGQATTVDLLASARDMGYDFTTLSKPVHPTEMLRRASECLQFPDMPELAFAI